MSSAQGAGKAPPPRATGMGQGSPGSGRAAGWSTAQGHMGRCSDPGRKVKSPNNPVSPKGDSGQALTVRLLEASLLDASDRSQPPCYRPVVGGTCFPVPSQCAKSPEAVPL